MQAAKREADRNNTSGARPSRWPLGLLDDARQRLQDEKEERARRSREEAGYLSRELRYTQQTVAGELAGWQSMHDKMGRKLIADYARGMIVLERTKLDGMLRALRKVRGTSGQSSEARPARSLQVPDREMVDAEGVAADEANGGGEPR
jgi:hypothetical protein